jgi:hypothetical protein
MRILDNKRFGRLWGWGGVVLAAAVITVWVMKPPRLMDIKRLPRSDLKPIPDEFLSKEVSGNTDVRVPKLSSEQDASEKETAALAWEPARDTKTSGVSCVEGVSFLGAIDQAESSFSDDTITITSGGTQRWAYAVLRFRKPFDLTQNTLVFKIDVNLPSMITVCFSDAERRTMGTDEVIALQVPADQTVSISGRDIKSFGIDKARVASIKISFAAPDGSVRSGGSVITISDIRVVSNTEFILEFS